MGLMKQVLIGLSAICTTEGRVDINSKQNYSFTWEIIKRVVPHRLVLGPLLFIIYINDLPRHINHFTSVVLFADDTNILITEKIMKISIERLSLL